MKHFPKLMKDIKTHRYKKLSDPRQNKYKVNHTEGKQTQMKVNIKENLESGQRSKDIINIDNNDKSNG